MATIEKITHLDVSEVADYLAGSFGVDREIPARKLRWASERGYDNLGYMLKHDGDVVGAFLATYGDTPSGKKICHLDWWHVHEDFRRFSIPLFRALLQQDVDGFTDYTPQPHVRPINKRLGFRDLDTRAIRIWNLRLPQLRSGIRITTNPSRISPLLDGRELRLFEDHRFVPGIGHLAIRDDGGNVCVVAFRRVSGRTTRVRILYVSNQAMFRRYAANIFWRLAIQHRSLFTVAELRVIGRPFALARRAPAVWRQYKSEAIPETELGELYSPLIWSS